MSESFDDQIARLQKITADNMAMIGENTSPRRLDEDAPLQPLMVGDVLALAELLRRWDLIPPEVRDVDATYGADGALVCLRNRDGLLLMPLDARWHDLRRQYELEESICRGRARAAG